MSASSFGNLSKPEMEAQRDDARVFTGRGSKPQIPLTLAHPAFGRIIDCIAGEPRITFLCDGSKLQRYASSGKFSAVNCVDVEPLTLEARRQ